MRLLRVLAAAVLLIFAGLWSVATASLVPGLGWTGLLGLVLVIGWVWLLLRRVRRTRPSASGPETSHHRTREGLL
jgi:hypothetical protein